MTVSPPSLGKSGRPNGFRLADLFLFNPIHELTLNGVSLRSCIPEELDDLRSVLQDLGRKDGHRRISTQRCEQVLPALCKLVPAQLSHHLNAIIQDENFPAMGTWECYISGILATFPNEIDSSKAQYLGQTIVRIEQELRAPTSAFLSNDFAQCADLLEGNALLRPFLCDATLSRIRAAQKQDDIIGIRILVAIEIRLSWTAYWDAVLCKFKGFNAPYFTQFFPRQDDTYRGVVRNYLDWLADYSGARKQLAEHFLQLDKPAKDFDLASAKRQLRRWKSDEIFPSNEVMASCLQSLFNKKPRPADGKEWGVSDFAFAICRRIKFLTDLLALFPAEPTGPISSLTHGAVNTGDWRDTQYHYWFNHWLEQEATNSTDKLCPPSI